MLKMASFNVEDLQKAIQSSIQDMSFEQQVKFAEEKSIKEERKKKELEDYYFQQQLMQAQELSQQVTPKRSFFDKFISLTPPEMFSPEISEITEQNVNINGQIYSEQISIAQRRLEAKNRKPFDRDLRIAQHESANDYLTRSEATSSGSDSDSGFGSEEREQQELEKALLISCDPSEQISKEDQELMLVLQLSLKENSPVKSRRSSPLLDYLGSSLGSSDNEHWADFDSNDQILLRQLAQVEDSSEKLTPLSNEELAFLKPFIEESQNEELICPEVLTLDQLDAQLAASQKQKKKKKSSQSSINHDLFECGSPVEIRAVETGTRPKVRKGHNASAFTPVHRQSPSALNGFSLENSPQRRSPKGNPWPKKICENSHRMSPPTAKLFHPVDKPGSGSHPRKSLNFSHLENTPAKRSTFGNGATSGNGAYRPIIVDGCNVAFQHGKNAKFSAGGLDLVFKYFVSRFGYSKENFTIVCKHVTRRNPEDLEICDKLYRDDVLIYTPRRFCGTKLIESDDDLFVLNLAKEKGGIVISRDHFRDAYQATQDPGLMDVIENRILQFSFKGDEVMFPVDPMGPGGPTLDQFLRF